MPIEVNRSERNIRRAEERLFLHDSELDYGVALLLAAEKQLAAAAASAAKAAPVSRGELDVLMAIRAWPSLSVSELRAYLAMTVPTFARILGQLDKRGLIAKKRAARDGRARTLHLSADGEALSAPIAEALRDALRPIFKASGAEQVMSARAVLERLTETTNG